MKLPLTLAIIPSLMITTQGRRFAIPQVSLNEIVRIRAADVHRSIERIGDSEVLRLRERLLPLVRLTSILGINASYLDPLTGMHVYDRRTRFSDRRKLRRDVVSDLPVPQSQRTEPVSDRRQHYSNAVKVVVMRLETNQYGLIVEDVLDSEEIVVKPIPEYLKQCGCYAGATIMGDGKVAMILDPGGIASLAGLNFAAVSEESEKQSALKGVQTGNRPDSLILFGLGGPERIGVPLNAISRIEQRLQTEITMVGDKEFIDNNQSLIRLVRLENILPFQKPHDVADHLYLLVPKCSKTPIAIYARQVWDIVDGDLKLDTSAVKGKAIKGSTIIGKQATVVLEMHELLDAIDKYLE